MISSENILAFAPERPTTSLLVKDRGDYTIVTLNSPEKRYLMSAAVQE